MVCLFSALLPDSHSSLNIYLSSFFPVTMYGLSLASTDISIKPLCIQSVLSELIWWCIYLGVYYSQNLLKIKLYTCNFSLPQPDGSKSQVQHMPPPRILTRVINLTRGESEESPMSTGLITFELNSKETVPWMSTD